MSGGIPTDRQLAALEQRVLTRIRRRAAVRARLISGASAAALVVGAIALVHPAGTSLSGGSAGSGAGDRSAASAAAVVLCHSTSAARSPATKVPLPGHPTSASIVAACAEPAAPSASGSPASGSPSTTELRSPIVCRNANDGWEVFPADGHPATLCIRNGLRAR
ncbi:hypothetical protein [Amnibacterium sp.]|uniref:hypothetical protein n=1 Tax=Amnibacterium sp. TaxID=1872496 RepID=UPI002611003C|nr:hypothetical protein [Amnibacterium sp.]MCU1472936.1 hypothetical protein [Amnibacterium sp.]